MNSEMTARQHSFWGETTAFLALFLDNVGVLIFFSAILVFTFNYPADIILTRMIPGTAVGICAGDLVYTWLAIRLEKKPGVPMLPRCLLVLIRLPPLALPMLSWARHMSPRMTRSSPGISAWPLSL